MHVSCYGMLGYALLSSATLGDALRLALRYPALLGTAFHLRPEDDGQRIWFSASDYGQPCAGGLQCRILPGVAESHL